MKTHGDHKMVRFYIMHKCGTLLSQFYSILLHSSSTTNSTFSMVSNWKTALKAYTIVIHIVFGEEETFSWISMTSYHFLCVYVLYSQRAHYFQRTIERSIKSFIIAFFCVSNSSKCIQTNQFHYLKSFIK